MELLFQTLQLFAARGYVIITVNFHGSTGYDQAFSLQMERVPSKMLYFPDEAQYPSKPKNAQLWYKTVNDWVDQWTRK